MSEIDRLLQAFIRGYTQRGEADARLYLEGLSGADRRELAALIDGYLERAPGRPWDPDAFRSSRRAAPLAARLARVHLEGAEGPTSLRELRARAKRTRADLASRLAAALGLEGGEERVAYHYHRMESGIMGAEEVSGPVLESLADLLATSRETVRRALARSEGQASPEIGSPAMARTTHPGADLDVPDLGDAGTDLSSAPELSHERVDEVFLRRGGP